MQDAEQCTSQPSPSIEPIPSPRSKDGNALASSVKVVPECERLVGKTASISASNSSKNSGARTGEQNRVSYIQFATVCCCMFTLGWTDGTTGPLLPRIRQSYGINYVLVSLIFVLACVGLVSGALVNIWFTDKLGYGKVVVLAAALQIVTLCVQAPQPPYPVFLLACITLGLGNALQVAQLNGYVGSLKSHKETKMGFVHAFYGLGAFSAPWVATQFAKRERWSFFYLVSLAIAVVNAFCLIAVFRGHTQKECLTEAGEKLEETKDYSSSAKFKQITTNQGVLFMGIFTFFYVGLEVTMGGWIVTYIIEVRGGGTSSGYVASGFWGGLTLGRVLLLPVSKYLGERRALFLYGVISLGLDFAIWFWPSLIGGAVIVSIIGMLIGPIFPIAMNQCGRFLPPSILTGAIGWIAGFGYVGSAVIPFITGAIAQGHGIKALHPVVIAMIVMMLSFFWLTPADRVAFSCPTSGLAKEVHEKQEMSV